MKQIKYLFFILSLALVFTGCETDPNGRMPDDIMDANTGVLLVTASDPFINVVDLAAYEITFDVDLLFDGDFEKLDVCVVYNGDYTKQYVLAEVTSVPQSLTFSSQDLVDAIDELSALTSINEGDDFDVFANITLSNGTYLPMYGADGVSTLAPSVRQIIGVLKGATSNIPIPVPCEFVLADYLGAKEASEYWAPDEYFYGVNVIEDPDYVGDDVGLILQGLWDGTWNLKVIVSLYDYSIVGNPDAQLMAATLWDYTNPVWSSIYGTVNTCGKALVVNIGSFCIDQGCFGGMPVTYTIYTPAEKSPEDFAEPPVREARSLEQ